MTCSVQLSRFSTSFASHSDAVVWADAELQSPCLDFQMGPDLSFAGGLLFGPSHLATSEAEPTCRPNVPICHLDGWGNWNREVLRDRM